MNRECKLENYNQGVKMTTISNIVNLFKVKSFSYSNYGFCVSNISLSMAKRFQGLNGRGSVTLFGLEVL